MSRYARSTIELPEWIPVSAERPCLVCGASSECTVLANGDFACCVHVVCKRPVLNGGWLHQLAEPNDRTPNPLNPGLLRGRGSRPADPVFSWTEGRPAL